MYCIQEASKRPSAEVLNFFYELGTQVCSIGLKKKRADNNAIRKKITDYFPGTSVPYHMLVKGSMYQGVYDVKTNKRGPDEFICDIEVGFPDDWMQVTEDVLQQTAVALMESMLLGGDVPDTLSFTQPSVNVPTMYKTLCDSFSGRTIEEEKKGGGDEASS